MLLFDPLPCPPLSRPHFPLPLPWYCVTGVGMYIATAAAATDTYVCTVVVAYDAGGGGGGAYGAGVYTCAGVGT